MTDPSAESDAATNHEHLAQGPDEQVTLVVDLDGTVIRTDTLFEAMFALLGKQPLLLPMMLVWLIQGGRARLKMEVAQRGVLDPSILPYHEPMLEFIRKSREEGRPVILATATDMLLAKPVHDHLQLFDHLIASEGTVNKRGQAKIDAIREVTGDKPFDYAGDSNADIPLVAAARKVVLVNPTTPLRQAAEKAQNIDVMFEDRPKPWRGLVKLLRPHQWVKNVLLFLPLLLSHELNQWTSWLAVILGIASFSLAASSVYALNDLMDIESDRKHPRKRLRPLASATVSVPLAVKAGMLCFLGSMLIAFLGVSIAFGFTVLAYLVFTTAYSTWIKRQLFMDVLMLAWLYTYRVIAGAIVVEQAFISPWLAGFCMFAFLSLAMLKRYAELKESVAAGKVNQRRGYQSEDLTPMAAFGAGSAYAAVLVFAMYISSSKVQLLYNHPMLLWAVCPVLIYVMSRLWFIACRGELHDDPLLYLAKDRTSLISGALAVACIVLAAVWPING